MERVVVPELLDDDRGTPQEVSDSLADLRMLNRWFGGAATTLSLLRCVARQRQLRHMTYLDVGGASGDVASSAAGSLRREGIELRSTVLDRAASHLKGIAGPAVCASAFQLPFRDKSFEVVGSSLFLHHLDPPEIAAFITESMRCAREAVIVNDLRRSRMHWLAAAAGRAIYRSPMTAHDASASVRRAYTVDELRELLANAGYPSAQFTHHYFFRLGIVIWRTAVS